MTLKCVADGVPVPNITWTKPDGSRLMRETSISMMNMVLTKEADFGQYNCSAENGFYPADFLRVDLVQISTL